MRVLFAVEYASISVIGCVGSNECEIFQWGFSLDNMMPTLFYWNFSSVCSQ
jgi:hypothetical protein